MKILASLFMAVPAGTSAAGVGPVSFFRLSAMPPVELAGLAHESYTTGSADAMFASLSSGVGQAGGSPLTILRFDPACFRSTALHTKPILPTT
jgi:hypothetical protein